MIEHRISLNGVECAVCEYNPSATTTVVALHGWLDNLASFEPLLPYLNNIRLIAFDFPGHGHSEHLPPGLSYHFVDGVYLVDDLAAHFQLGSIYLLGHSMGGSVAALYAAAQPERVKKLLMIEALGPLTSSPEESQERLRNAIEQRRQIREKKKPLYKDFQAALMARSQASKIQPDLIRPIVERGLAAASGGLTWRADARLRIASALRYGESQLKALLREIRGDICIIEAEQGYFRNSELMQARKAWFQSLRLEILPGGHHLHMEYPQQIGEIITDFFCHE